MKTKILTFLLLTLSLSIYSQQTVKEGSLLKIDFNENIIDTSNKTQHWQSIISSTGYNIETFENIFCESQNQYFIKHISYSGNHAYSPPPSFQTKLVKYSPQNEFQLFDANYPECGTGTYLSGETTLLNTGTGIILTNNLSESGYLLTSGFLFALNSGISPLRAVHIVGKIKNDFLIAAYDSGYSYYLINFDKKHNAIIQKKVNFPNMESSFSPAPEKCRALNDSLFIFSFEWTAQLFIDRFEDSSFVKIDSLAFDLSQDFWTIKNGFVYFIEGQNLVRIFFNKEKLSFGKKEIIMRVGQNRGTDINDNILSTIVNDSVYVYSIAQNKLINKFYYPTPDNYFNVLVDSPFVYIPVTDKITGIELSKNITEEFQLFQNYPNPFNPSTTIKYSIPNLETRHASSLHVTLKVYDMLGREITTLVNEEKAPGNYEVIFNGNGLACGVYLYMLQSGSFSETKKFLLLK